MITPSKPRVVAALRAQLVDELDALLAVIAMSRDEATHGDSRPENQYDTRALEASYLAAGQGQRLAELKVLRDWFDALEPSRPFTRVGPGALTCFEDDNGAIHWCFVAPSGGNVVRVGDTLVRVISPASPLGQALIGLSEDDEAELDGPRDERTVVVVRVV